jgi:hypothetical protein
MKIIALEGEDRAPEHRAAAALVTQIALIAAGARSARASARSSAA